MTIDRVPYRQQLPDVQITYSVEWGLLNRVTHLAARIERLFGFPVKLRPRHGSGFEVLLDHTPLVDNSCVFCRLPDNDEILRRIAAACGLPSSIVTDSPPQDLQ